MGCMHWLQNPKWCWHELLWFYKVCCVPSQLAKCWRRYLWQRSWVQLPSNWNTSLSWSSWKCSWLWIHIYLSNGPVFSWPKSLPCLAFQKSRCWNMHESIHSGLWFIHLPLRTKPNIRSNTNAIQCQRCWTCCKRSAPKWCDWPQRLSKLPEVLRKHGQILLQWMLYCAKRPSSRLYLFLPMVLGIQCWIPTIHLLLGSANCSSFKL